MSHEPEHSPQMLERRELLRRAAWMLGGAISAPAALAILQGCSAKESAQGAAAWVPKFLKPSQGKVVAEIAEIIIPRTATSGAIDAGVPAFIDLVLAEVYPKDAQDRFNAGYAEFEAAAKALGKPFLEQEPAQRVAFVQRSLDTALSAEHDAKPFILMARELTLLGFFTSRVGITENMEYVAVPTAYHGCVPLSQMKKHVYWE
jgi:gluconate 2-dehydrogenase gamma chain